MVLGQHCRDEESSLAHPIMKWLNQFVLALAITGMLSQQPACFAEEKSAQNETKAKKTLIEMGKKLDAFQKMDRRFLQTVQQHLKEHSSRSLGGIASSPGIVGTLVREKSLKAFNPFKPGEFGDSFSNLHIDPEAGRVIGIILFSIRF